jgi:hypothetical protein
VLRPAAIALLGLLSCLVGATFDSPSLYVPGAARVAITTLAALWVGLAAYGASLVRQRGPRMVVEEEPYPVWVEVRAGVLPPPAGGLFEGCSAGPAGGAG